MKILRTSLPFVVAMAASPAVATDDALCALARSLDRFLVEATSYAPATTCPVVGFAIPAGGEMVSSQAGAYIPATGRIELAHDLDLKTPLGQSFLLHELVHAAQYRHGADQRAECLAQLETEAYSVQAAFLYGKGLTRDAAMMQAFASQLGQCDGSDPYAG